MGLRRILLLLVHLGLCVFCASNGRYKSKTYKKNDLSLCPEKICPLEDVEDYPREQIERLVSQIPYLLSGNVFAPVSEDLSMEDRGGIPEPYKPFCEAKEVYVVPGYMMDIRKNYRTVLNVANFSQAITYQVCRSSSNFKAPANECSNLDRGSRYRTRCEQEFGILKLAVLKMDNTDMEYAEFQIPTSCSCKYSLNED